MRIKLKEPARSAKRSSLIWACISGLLIIGFCIVPYLMMGCNFLNTLHWYGMTLKGLWKEDLRLFFGALVLPGIILLVFIGSICNYLNSSRRLRRRTHFTHLDFQPEGLLMECIVPEKTVFFPYRESSLKAVVKTNIVRGYKKSVHYIISEIKLTLQQENGTTLIFSHKGGLPFIATLLDFAPYFKEFQITASSVIPFYQKEPDQYTLFVREQISNYQKFGKMLYYSSHQRFNLIILTILMFFLSGVIITMFSTWVSLGSSLFFLLLLCFPLSFGVQSAYRLIRDWRTLFQLRAFRSTPSKK